MHWCNFVHFNIVQGNAINIHSTYINNILYGIVILLVFSTQYVNGENLCFIKKLQKVSFVIESEGMT